MIKLRENDYINLEICNSTVDFKQKKCLKEKTTTTTTTGVVKFDENKRAQFSPYGKT